MSNRAETLKRNLLTVIAHEGYPPSVNEEAAGHLARLEGEKFPLSPIETFHLTCLADLVTQSFSEDQKLADWLALSAISRYASNSVLARYGNYFQEQTHPETTAARAFGVFEAEITDNQYDGKIDPLLTLRASVFSTLTAAEADYVFLSRASTTWSTLSENHKDTLAIEKLEKKIAWDAFIGVVKPQANNIQASFEMNDYENVRLKIDEKLDNLLIVFSKGAISYGVSAHAVGGPSRDDGIATAVVRVNADYFCGECDKLYLAPRVEPLKTSPEEFVAQGLKLSLEAFDTLSFELLKCPHYNFKK